MTETSVDPCVDPSHQKTVTEFSTQLLLISKKVTSDTRKRAKKRFGISFFFLSNPVGRAGTKSCAESLMRHFGRVLVSLV